MRARLQIAVESWVAWREIMRRWPWVDFVLGWVLFAFGVAAEVDWRGVVTGSKFFSFWYLIHYIGAFSIIAGVWQIAAAHYRALKQRQIASAIGIWVLGSLAWNVDSLIGHISWAGWTFLEILTFLSVTMVP